tara:strand:- start:589 stop:885 length:297 start_codon:yes stop_codon:yes gene_type:complete
MDESRKNFFTAVEKKISSAEVLLKKPQNLQKQLAEIQSILETEYASIFASLNDTPLSEVEKHTLKSLMDRLYILEKKVSGKLTLFDDFQKYIQVSLEK